MSSKGSKSLFSKGTSQSRLSRDAESALLSATAKKAELLCRARKLKEKLALEKKEFELQQQKAILELDTEVEVEQAKIHILERFEETSQKGRSLPDRFLQPDRQVADSVKHWLNSNPEDGKKGQATAVATKSKVGLQEDTQETSDSDDGKEGQATAIATKSEVDLQEDAHEKSDDASTYQTSESEIDSLASCKIEPARDLLKRLPSEDQGRNSDKKVPVSIVDQNPWISPTPHSAGFKFEKLMKHDRSEDAQPSRQVGVDAQGLSQPANLNHRSCAWSVVEDDIKKERNDINEKTERERSDLSTLATVMMEYQKKASLPHRNMPTFSGDPMEYHSFMRAFEYSVERKTDDEMDKLYFLDQCTHGEPNRLVKGFLNRDPEKAYKEAKAMLTRKFGNKFVIVSAFKTKAEKWPDVKRDDSKAWSSFSIFLTEFVNTVTDLGCLQEVDHSGTIKVLLEKIPYTTRNQWRVLVDSLEEREGKIAGFTEFVQFIEKQTRIVCNPIYGNITDNADKAGKQQSRGQKTSAKRASFATIAKEKGCKLCEKKNHSLAECRKFQKMSYAERTSFVKQNKLCFGCLEEGHFKSACTNRDSVKCQKCKKKHPTSLHDPDRDKRQQEQTKENDSATATEQKKEVKVTSGHVGVQSAATSTPQTDNPLMTIIPILVKHEDSDNMVATYAFLDNGSSAVFANYQLCHDMNLRTRKRKLIIETLNSSEVVDSEVVIDRLQVSGLSGENFVELPQVYIKEIPVSSQDVPTQEDLERWSHLSEVELPELPREYPCIHKVSLMIGNNTPAATMPLRIATGNLGDPYAILTPLGWAVYGIPGKLSNSDVVTAHFCAVIKDGVDDLEQQFRSYVNMEFNETLSDDRKTLSKEDHQFLDIISNSIEFEDGHYSMNLPIRDKEVKMPNNRIQAQQRAEMLKRKFVKNKEFYSEYQRAMQLVIDKGYAEPVPKETSDNDKTWYIPHHGVYHPQKKKLRVVYDCAAVYQGVSLNKQLLQGPDMTNSLLGVLLRFRQQPVALVADIEAMFHQVKVNEEDRDLLRFLWWSDGDIEKPLEDYRMTAHIFGATSSPACANYALKKTAEDNKDEFDVEVIDTLNNNFYVDDCLKATSSESKAARLAQDLICVCQKGGFHLRKWISNSDLVMESIPPSERSEESRNLDFQETSSQKTLGMLWLMQPDKFGFEICIKDKPSTRRGMLSTLCSLYDPIGLLSPVILPAKQMLQELCRLKIGWDEDVPEEIRRKWSKWLTSIPELQHFTVQRCWKPSGFENPEVQVHHFADASESGYGTASYLRLNSGAGEVECNLIMSKARVAPIKQVSIPRMELSAATLAVKVDTMLKRELDIHGETIFWSDSQTVLKYIRNETARFPVFIANRVSVIRDGSSPDQWRYVPSEFNPADYASRGLTVDQLMNKPEWLKGPEFLYKQESEWPSVTTSGESEGIPDVENTRVTEVAVHASTVRDVESEAAEAEISKEEDTVDYLIRYYSDWTRLRRAVAWWLRLKKVLQQRAKGAKPNHDTKYLSADEIQQAEETIIRFVQRQAFPQEISVLQRIKKAEDDFERHESQKSPDNKDQCKKKRIRKDSSILDLNPVLRDGLLKVGGRLHNASLPEQTKHQLILPKKHHVVELIINHIHRKCNHQGRNHILAELRQKYWVIQAGVAVKSIVRKCTVCRKLNARVSSQLMGDLPTNRVRSGDPPFTSTGMDYFGPFLVKQARSIKKKYGVIFTCMNTRAVHIEIASTMDTSSCINALRRFISRRGMVQEITSDNGTNLVGANQELRRALEQLNQEDLQRFSASRGIKWHFNPPAASHKGGVWERQIRTIRKILQSMLDEQHLKVAKTEEQLHTLMCEVEATINGRPLTRASEDPQDLEVLTPNHLLQLRGPAFLPPGKFSEKDNFVRQRWRQVQYLADLFWKRWMKEYLTMLQRRQKWLQPERNLQVGDIVLIVNDKAPRNSWAMGRVIRTLPDREGYVRQVQVQTKSSILTRPVSKLCMLLEADIPERASASVEESRKETQHQARACSSDQHQAGAASIDQQASAASIDQQASAASIDQQASAASSNQQAIATSSDECQVKVASTNHCQTRTGRRIKKRQNFDL